MLRGLIDKKVGCELFGAKGKRGGCGKCVKGVRQIGSGEGWMYCVVGRLKYCYK